MRVLSGVAVLMTLGCADHDVTTFTPAEESRDRGYQETTNTARQPRIEREALAPLRPYEACDTDSDCGSLSCLGLLGTQVCVAVGCLEEPTLCARGELCIAIETIEPRGVCALTGATDYCGRNCRDYLVCGLSADCVQNGCCGARNELGCASACETLDKMECEIDPRCPTECCG